MKVHGSCHCGAIAFEAEVDEDRVTICHCTDCQKLSSTAFRVTAFARESHFRILRGSPRIYIKIADSGSRRQQAFCETCGSNIFATTDEPAGNRDIGVRVGVLDERRDLPPTRQIFCDSALPWATGLPGEVLGRA